MPVAEYRVAFQLKVFLDVQIEYIFCNMWSCSVCYSEMYLFCFLIPCNLTCCSQELLIPVH